MPSNPLQHRVSHGARTIVKPRRRAFTLVEAMVAMTITAIAGSTLLLGVNSMLQTTEDTRERTIARGVAEQLMDEIAGARYHELGSDPRQSFLGPGGDESATGTRERYDDIDDYNGFRSRPLVDPWGVPLGRDGGGGQTRPDRLAIASSYLANWREEVDVYYVSEADMTTRLSGGQTSNYRAAEVRILVEDAGAGRREIVKLKRVFSYVSVP